MVMRVVMRVVVNLLVLEAFVEGLDISEYTFPVWLLHHHHILHIQQGHDAGFLIGNSESQFKVVSSVLRVQLVEVEGIGVEVVD